jgi:NADPH2:quinone reductase
MVSFGNASGPVPPVNLGILPAKGSLYVTRPTLNTYIASREELVKRSSDLFNAVKSKKVKIETTARYKLADAANAHRDLEGRKTTGSVVLIP